MPALYEAIKKASHSKKDIIVFDRGIQKRSTFCDFTARGIHFVTRIKTNTLFEVAGECAAGSGDLQPAGLVIEDDRMVYLFGGKRSEKTPHPFRLIRARSNDSRNEPIWFLTNIAATEMSAVQVTEIYRKRWDIEVFFKFAKQELDLEHITVRTVSGFKVMLYVKLIASILLTAYRELNKLKGYKLVRLRFANELEEELIREVVIICGGDPQKIPRFARSYSFVH